MSEATRIVESFRDALLRGDDVALRDHLSEDAYFALSGRSPLARSYEGPDAVVELFRRMRELSGGTLRPSDPNSFDVLESEYHCALIDRWLAERDGRELASHQVWILHLKDGRVGDGFFYFDDQHAFDDFWS